MGVGGNIRTGAGSNPEPQTLNLNTDPETLNTEFPTLNPQPQTPKPQYYDLNPKPPNPKPQTRHNRKRAVLQPRRCPPPRLASQGPNPLSDISIYLSIYLYIYTYIYAYMYSYPLCGETLEQLARFVRKLPKDSNLAENGFPGFINQEFLGSFSTDESICSA